MGIFSNKKEGGLMDVIRCDEKDYLIWKWSPAGEKSRRENSIRYGSSLRVRQSEVAVFLYKQKDGTMQDFIEGQFDQTIKTANFPVLTGIVGAAFGGNSPFQAEIYYINLAGTLQIPFFVKEFDVADPRFTDYTAPVSSKGKLTFGIKDYRRFIEINRMIDFSLEEFHEKIKSAVIRYTKSVIANSPALTGIPLVQIERNLDVINEMVLIKLKESLAEDFGIHITRLDISDVTLNKDSDDYKSLVAVTKDLQTEMLRAQTAVGIQNLVDQQAIGAENLQESLRVQREEAQRAQRLQTEGANLTAHQLDIQADVAKTAAESLGNLGGGIGGGTGGSGGGFNPAGVMAGMMMGGAVGTGMSNMMGNMMQNVNQPQPPAPPAGAIAEYHIAENGAQSGPYTLSQLKDMVGSRLLASTHIWKQGMAGWATADEVPEVAALFASVPPPPPPAPPVP